jgi:hypothetical protein
MLRHTLATLAYRAGKVLRDAPEDFHAYQPSEGVRTPAEILAHMSDLMDWALSIVNQKQAWTDTPVQAWDADVRRFFDSLVRLDAALDGPLAEAAPAERLFQGPIADALWHVGQLAMLRRMAGAPIRGENYYQAQIAAGRVGIDQAPPRREF